MESLTSLLASGGWQAYAVVIAIGAPVYLLAAWVFERCTRDSDWMAALRWFRN